GCCAARSASPRVAGRSGSWAGPRSCGTGSPRGARWDRSSGCPPDDGKDATMKRLWLFAFVTAILGCSEVVPGTCYVNPTGGAGGADTIPAGAGVGATTSGGDYATEPPSGPLDYGGGDSPCDDPCMECPAAPGGDQQALLQHYLDDAQGAGG